MRSSIELYRLKGELTLQQANDEHRAKSREQRENSKEPGVSSKEQEAEACFLKAIEIAQKQQAKSLELRAVMSLVRLRHRQAQDHATRNTQHDSRPTQHEARTKLAEAHHMLSEVYNWFTEGFDTRDLQEAQALLEELA